MSHPLPPSDSSLSSSHQTLQFGLGPSLLSGFPVGSKSGENPIAYGGLNGFSAKQSGNAPGSAWSAGSSNANSNASNNSWVYSSQSTGASAPNARLPSSAWSSSSHSTHTHPSSSSDAHDDLPDLSSSSSSIGSSASSANASSWDSNWAKTQNSFSNLGIRWDATGEQKANQGQQIQAQPPPSASSVSSLSSASSSSFSSSFSAFIIGGRKSPYRAQDFGDVYAQPDKPLLWFYQDPNRKFIFSSLLLYLVLSFYDEKFLVNSFVLISSLIFS